jgi:hypothetical protein
MAGGAAPPLGDPLSHRIEVVRDRFVTAVRRCGVVPRFAPQVEVLSTPTAISYDADRRTLVVGRWETLPPPIQAFFARWAARDFPGQPPHRLFDELFNGFLVGHELGHWAADQSDRGATLDHYSAEIEANRYAIAFSDQESPNKTASIVRRFSYLSTLPRPVPAGEDQRSWFNAHYLDLARTNPVAYNWYQGVFMTEAWRQHRSTSFCQLAKLGPANGR